MSQFNPNSNPNQSPYPYQQQPAPVPPQMGQPPAYGQPQMGQQPVYGQPFPQAPMQNYQSQGMYGTNPEDTGSFGWAVLGFFIPLVGLILWLVWKNTKPQSAIQG